MHFSRPYMTAFAVVYTKNKNKHTHVTPARTRGCPTPLRNGSPPDTPPPHGQADSGSEGGCQWVPMGKTQIGPPGQVPMTALSEHRENISSGVNWRRISGVCHDLVRAPSGARLPLANINYFKLMYMNPSITLSLHQHPELLAVIE